MKKSEYRRKKNYTEEEKKVTQKIIINAFNSDRAESSRVKESNVRTIQYLMACNVIVKGTFWSNVDIKLSPRSICIGHTQSHKIT